MLSAVLRPRFRLVWLAPALAALAGCERDEIRAYRVPRAEVKEQPKVRLLGALVPRADRFWVFKAMGPSETVAEQAEKFDAFLKSLKFAADKPIAWTVPEGWTEEPGKGMRYATLKAGSLEVTVSALPADQNNILDNVNRWRGQVSLPPVSAADLPKNVREEQVDGTKVVRVDIEGTAANRPAMSPPAKAAPPPTPAPAAPEAKLVTYDVPTGWKDVPASGIRVATLRIADGPPPVEVTIIPLGGPAGGTIDNIKRWRGELGLSDDSDADAVADAKPTTVSGSDATVVDLVGTNGKRTLGAICPRGGRTWFIKLSGPAEVVGPQKAAFEQFLRSVRFAPGV